MQVSTSLKGVVQQCALHYTEKSVGDVYSIYCFASEMDHYALCYNKKLRLSGFESIKYMSLF